MAEATKPDDDRPRAAPSRTHLAPAGPERPQQGELPGALGDDDRERVVDDERADEEGDQGERQQERVEDGDDLLERVLALLGELGAGDGLGVRREGGGDPLLAASACETPSSPAAEIQSNLPGSPDDGLGGGGVEERGLGAAPRVELPEPGDPDHGEVPHPVGDRHRRRCRRRRSRRRRRSWRRARCRSGRSAARPSTSVQPLSSGEVSQLSPKFGRPLRRHERLALAVEHADLGDDLALGGGDAVDAVDRRARASASTRLRWEPKGVSTSVLERTTTSIEA